MTIEQLDLAQVLAEAINLLVELESYLATPDPIEFKRIAKEVIPRLAELKNLINN